MDIERQKRVRSAHRGVITKLIREIDEIVTAIHGLPADNTTEERTRLEIIKVQLEAKLKILADIDSSILATCDAEDIEQEVEDSEAIIANLMKAKRRIEQIIDRETHAEHQEPTRQFAQSSQPSRSSAKTRLPKLTLPKFKGNVTNWTTFWDSYRSAVHDNDELSNIDKFNYLNSLIEGAAARAIQGLTLTSHNYHSAIEILKERFGKPQQIIAAHMDELLKIPNCANDRPASLRFVYDKISVHVRGLASLGVSAEQYGSLLIPIIMDKLPSEIRLQVARRATDDVWQIKDLLNTIKIEVEAREASETRVHSQRPQASSYKQSHSANANNATASSLVTNDYKLQCVYCEGEHYSASCKRVTDATNRKNILRKSNRCFNCLKPNHRCGDCKSPRNCRHCNNRHHQSICEQAHAAVQTTAKPPAHNVPSPEEQTGASNVNANTSNVVTSKKTVLLQTARAIASDESSTRSTPIRILFDNGSQRSYITENLRARLNLRSTKNERLNLNTFGNSKYKQQRCDVVKLRLHKPGIGQSIEITALTFPVICSALPCKVNVDYPHLEGLELADDLSDSVGSIDLLIGSDFYWNIVTGDTKRGVNGPIAVNSKLGWLLSGPVEGSVDRDTTHSNLIIEGQRDVLDPLSKDDMLTNTLKGFWETESIGIRERASEDLEKPFVTPEIRQNGGRYEVGLPWKEEVQSMCSNHYNMSYNRLKGLQRRLMSEPELCKEYDNIIKDQLEKGIIERVPEPKENEANNVDNVHYMPHHGVVRRDKQTTKLRVVYDGSAKSKDGELSINDCLETGPNFVPKLFDILVNFRWNPVALTADIEKAFLMIGIRESDRDMLRFLWFKDPDKLNSEIEHLRFTRLVFGLRPSPAVLGSTILHHLNSYKADYPKLVDLINKCLYVDDLVTGAENESKAFDVYQTAKKVISTLGSVVNSIMYLHESRASYASYVCTETRDLMLLDST